MVENESAPADPRWGQQNRDRKAEAILATLQLNCGRDLTCGTWLDIGCGSGGVAATLAAHVQHVIGVDPESWERWNQFRKDHPNLDLRQGSYRDLRTLLQADSIDIVVCNQVYEHVDDPVALLAEIHRVMKPGGICYFAGPNLLWPIEPHVYWPIVHWLPRDFAHRLMRCLGYSEPEALDAWSTHYWRLTKWFRSAGFASSNAIAVRIDSELAERSWRVRLPRWFAILIDTLAPLSPGFVFVLRKP